MEQAKTIGLDIAMQVFQLHGAGAAGHVLFRKRLSRGTRANHPTVSKLAARSTTPSTGTRPCVVRMPKIPQ